MITVYDHKDHQPYQNDLHPTWNDFTLSYETQDDWEPPDPPEEDVFDEVPENTIRIWDLRTGKQLQTIPIAYGSIRKFLLDRNLLCAVGEFREEQRVVLWDLRLANSFFELKCVDADLNPDGTLLALSQADGTIEFWGISDPSSSG